MLENAIERRLNTLVKQAGGYLAKLDARANKGVPDRIVTIGGRTFYLELKTETGVVSPLQAEHHRRIEAAGGEIIVAFGLEEVRRAIAP